MDAVKEVRELKNQLAYSKNIGFFFGAGTSCALKIPNIATLTTEIEKRLKGDHSKRYGIIRDSLKPSVTPSGRSVNIEDILNHTRRIREITNDQAAQDFLTVSGEAAKNLDKEISGADYMLRTVMDKKHHINYRIQRLESSRREWEKFRSQRGIGFELQPMDHDGRLRPLLGRLRSDLEHLLHYVVRPMTVDAQVLRLSVAILTYAEENENEKVKFLPLTPAIHQALRELLNTVLAQTMHSQLPDIVHQDENSRMKSYCKNDWLELREAYEKVERL